MNKIIADYLAAFAKVNPTIALPTIERLSMNGWYLMTTAHGGKYKYRPSKLVQMTNELNKRLRDKVSSEQVFAQMIEDVRNDR